MIKGLLRIFCRRFYSFCVAKSGFVTCFLPVNYFEIRYSLFCGSIFQGSEPLGLRTRCLGRISMFVLLWSAILLFSGGVFAAELPFPVGERLVYSVSWNRIPIAWSEVTTSMETFEGRKVLAIRMRSRNYSIYNWIVKADDRHESLVDPETLLPIQFTKNLKENDYRCHEITRFDYKAGKAHYESQTNGSKKTYDIDPDTRDILSFMYFMRATSLEPNSTMEYRVMADEKIYDLVVKTKGIVSISLPDYDQKIPSLRMVPEAKFDGLFVRKGNGTIWVSRDSRRLLTFAKMKVPFGKVRITLREVDGPGYDFWIKGKKR